MLSRGMLYRVEGARVYYGPNAIRGAHAPSFELLEAPWAKDHSRVYFEGRAVSKAQPHSFRTLGSACGYDAKRVFLVHGGHVFPNSYAGISGFVPSSARAIQKDGQLFLVSERVWLGDTLLVWLRLEAASFEALGRGYARDRSTVVWCGKRTVKVLADADLESFRVDESGARDRHGPFLQGQRDSERLPVELEADPQRAASALIQRLWHESLTSLFSDFDRSIVTEDGFARVGNPPVTPSAIPSHRLHNDGPQLTLEAGEHTVTGSVSGMELLAGWLYGIARDKRVGERICLRVMLRTDGEIVSEAGTPPRWQHCVDLAYLFEKLGHRQEALFLLQRVARWRTCEDGASAHDCAETRAIKLLGALMAELPKALIPRGSTTQAALKWLIENQLFRSPNALVRRDVASNLARLTMQTTVDRARLATLALPLLPLLDDPEPAVRAEAAASFDFLCSNTLNGKVYDHALVYADALAARNINLDMQSARRWACLTALGRLSEADEAWQLCLQLTANDPPAERTVSRSHPSIHAWRTAREREFGAR